MTSFEDYKIIGPDDKWNESWVWITGIKSRRNDE